MELIILLLAALALPAVTLLLWPNPPQERFSRYRELSRILKGRELTDGKEKQ